MQIQNNKNKFTVSTVSTLSFIILFIFLYEPILAVFLIVALIFFFVKDPKSLSRFLSNYSQRESESQKNLTEDNPDILEELNEESNEELNINNQPITPSNIFNILPNKVRLEKRKKYLHVALNSTLEEVADIITRLPPSDRILIEVGTPLIKIYGIEAISLIKSLAPIGAYIVADNKCTDLAAREVEMMADAGANASTCLGVAPIETIDIFVEECKEFNIDSIVDMMNVENALSVLKKLKKLPNVVMLHRGVDETELSTEKQIPFYQIKQIKGNYDVLVAVAGGDTIREAQRAIFNDADIVVVWKNFYQSSDETAKLAESFLQEIK